MGLPVPQNVSNVVCHFEIVFLMFHVYAVNHKLYTIYYRMVIVWFHIWKSQNSPHLNHSVHAASALSILEEVPVLVILRACLIRYMLTFAWIKHMLIVILGSSSST